MPVPSTLSDSVKPTTTAPVIWDVQKGIAGRALNSPSGTLWPWGIMPW